MAETTKCCIAGGGPAGIMLGFLLARAGVDVVVLEKHGDFLRDFRGDTIHPSTLQLMDELGLLDEFLKRPHQEAPEIRGWIGDTELVIADFRSLKTRCRFVALMPQWDFLNFIAEQAKRYPGFHLKMNAEVTGLIGEDGVIRGAHVKTAEGPIEIRADLIVGADGRSSTVRNAAGLQVEDYGAPMDVLWMRISRKPGDPSLPFGRFDRGKIMVLLDREDYWQCGYVIRKGGFEETRKKGIEKFRATIAELGPFLQDRVEELRDWDDVKLLTVKVDRLRQWSRAGVLCIGDAAHAMSPVGGVGINLAVQDAVAAANILAAPLRMGSLSLDHLQQVQRRRSFPTVVTQRVQIAIQKRVIGRVLGDEGTLKVPWVFRLLQRWPYLRRFPARFIGIGARPEHIHTPEIQS